MKEFKSKEEVFEYLKKKFLNKSTLGIAVIGSTAKKPIKEFSDVDLEVITRKPTKPYYELCTINGKLFLVNAYFYLPGKKVDLPARGRILYGEYYKPIEHPKNLIYNSKERNVRDNQMFIDMLFKYARSKDKKYLKIIDKYWRAK
jgi:predicted nucleotidyltransferase